VDYRAINRFDTVKQGQLLARIIPAKPGEDGHDVTGRALRARPVRPARFRAGRNVDLSPSGAEAWATRSGVARFENGKLSVEDLLKIEGDVNFRVGNIDFTGNHVEILGGVMPGFTVKSDRDILIRGLVDKARVEAGGDIQILGGVFGKPDVFVKAGHNLYLNFAANATIEALNDIVAGETLLQCEARAGNTIVLNAAGSGCVGGRLVAGVGIEANVLGVERSSARTIAQLESDPRLGRLREQWENELQRTEDPEARELLQAKIEAVDQQIARQKHAAIVVKDTLYPGVEIIIDGIRYVPTEPMCQVRFSLDDQERRIVTTPL
jgi:uncharacterized protein (DUF342 family)